MLLKGKMLLFYLLSQVLCYSASKKKCYMRTLTLPGRSCWQAVISTRSPLLKSALRHSEMCMVGWRCSQHSCEQLYMMQWCMAVQARAWLGRGAGAGLLCAVPHGNFPHSHLYFTFTKKCHYKKFPSAGKKKAQWLAHSLGSAVISLQLQDQNQNTTKTSPQKSPNTRN